MKGRQRLQKSQLEISHGEGSLGDIALPMQAPANQLLTLA
jgi:hypothetical protein